MRKKLLIILIITSLCLLFTAAKFTDKTLKIKLTSEYKTFEKEYELPFSARIKTAVKYRGDLREFCQSEFSGNVTDFFDYLNPDIVVDTAAFIDTLTVAPVEPQAIYSGNGRFDYFEGKNGRTADLNKTLYNQFFYEKSEVVFSFVSPSETLTEVKERTKKVASFSTSVASSSLNRKKNVRLAAERLDGICVKPGETLSFNLFVGQRTIENGFFVGKVIIGGVYADGIGGGVCQVSTTLYNAWLKAGMSAVFSRGHSLPASYVAPGLDAMVTDYSDLVLINDGNYPVYLNSFCDANIVKFDVYGEKRFKNVSLSSELIKSYEYDEYEVIGGDKNEIISLPQGKKTYRSYAEYERFDGSKFKVKLRDTTYLPVKGKKMVTFSSPDTDKNDEQGQNKSINS